MHHSFSTLFALLALLIPFASALANLPGTPCTVVGSSCSWPGIEVDGVPHSYNGFCAPDLYCGDDGAICTSDDNCYDYCGTDGTCGGNGAVCTSNVAFAHGQGQIACFTPAFTCSPTTYTCIPASSPGMRRRDREQANLPLGPTACGRPTHALCVHDGRSECVDVTSDFENCGACGRDCGETEGANTVDCVLGNCMVASCRRGWAQTGNACVPVSHMVPLASYAQRTV
ncbi:hypothetical protein CALVIDRAFT_251399 [Calocera viscosa TUFC12733]|uniref:Protein CPL1-like domain-containing protein n=1 Tax=Calocera viscosa (strain TUFC12733) TaxID=1330018 RepID=A0A167JFS5_CALVF|nr:hypothetical protein CALVIDRAFT_251399 [Calocera viscosa TUFC12733]